ncbi:nucleotide sugar dehydrogenase [Delftia sp.]|uniref:nucleotide sugar dehydrogenase n=1 Tax=Delftia sp. TaxID=1886637 RepID=UPI00259CFB40|nr:nucleotide sugar dehydrogenase [Delftia sp.]
MQIDKAKIAVVGLGYVGLPLAVEFGRCRDVLGFDINVARVAELRGGQDATLEVSPDELKAARRLKFSSDPRDLADCQVFIVTVPTPVDKANRPDMTPLVKASETVGRAMPPGALVIYESTVYPGATEEICVPVPRAPPPPPPPPPPSVAGYSIVTSSADTVLERINPGDKVNTLTKIKKITSGSTSEAADAVDALYASIIVAGTHKASSLKVAEAAKVIENTQRDLNIALVNELSVIFERIGIDTLDVLEAAGSKGISAFPTGAGRRPLIGVDPYYLTHKAEEVGYHPQVILAGRRINDNMGRYVARNTIRLMLKNGMDVPRCRIGVLGITFKENCPDIRYSKVVDRSASSGLGAPTWSLPTHGPVPRRLCMNTACPGPHRCRQSCRYLGWWPSATMSSAKPCRSNCASSAVAIGLCSPMKAFLPAAGCDAGFTVFRL